MVLASLPSEKRPRLVRGDNAFGNESVTAEMEALEQDYLFKLRQTAGVKRLIERQWSRQDWQNVGQGFDAVEAMLRLSGWSRARRVVVMRRAVKDSLLAEEKTVGKRAKRQQSLHFADPLQPVKLWESRSVSTTATGPIVKTVSTNLKTSGAGAATPPRIWNAAISRHGCGVDLQLVELWYGRLAHPKTRLEAISRPATARRGRS